MIDKIKAFLTVLDLNSGTVMTLATGTILGLMIAAFVAKRPIDASILTAYGMILGCFAVHRTTTATTSIVTNSSQGTDESPKP